MTSMARYQHIQLHLYEPTQNRRFAALSCAVLASLAIHGGALLLIPGDKDEGVANFGYGGMTVSLGPAGRDAGGEVATEQPASETLEDITPPETETLEAVKPVEQQVLQETLQETATIEPVVVDEVTVPEPEAVLASEVAEVQETEPAPTLPEPDLALNAEVADVSDLSAPEVATAEAEIIEVEPAEVKPVTPLAVEPEEVVATENAATPPLPKRRPAPEKRPLVQEVQKAEVAEPKTSSVSETASDIEPREEARAEVADGLSKTETANQVAGQGGKSGDSGLSEAGQGDNTAGGGAPGTSSDYYREVTAWLEKHKRYPRRSKLRNEQGVVMLRFVVNRDGMVSVSAIEESSGYKRLDKEAMGMIERAQPLPPIPEDMRQANLDLVIPVKFNLR
ncbi:energy transducer TonB [Denitrobaculum tricleocarpae]|uniref:TonB family protein n=1 Tax=Denitrobaculum tricleocarpae TaxID=2591009 RepID=A0A545U106_9PROT|nr:energy transducer TonB [Denitrobaculum tricleocarpae]TQV83145.1 TonB family protein [Denitrobaculum tricleocarpae]